MVLKVTQAIKLTPDLQDIDDVWDNAKGEDLTDDYFGDWNY
ncbi:hypothetical protein [Bacillus pseudomycoides]|nr:hypothetical protein [Bacillus pseudomycoides]